MADQRLSSVQGILRAARQYGIKDPAALVAVADEESSLNPRAYGDAGIGGSRGLFQLYAKGMGAGVPDSVAYDPYGNASIIAKAWAGQGGRTLSGPGALLPYYERVGRGADNAGAARKAAALYAQAQQLVRQAGGAAPAASIPPGATPGTQGNPGSPGVAPTAGTVTFAPALMPSLMRYLQQSQAAALAGRAQPEISPILSLVTSGVRYAPGQPGSAPTVGVPAAPTAPSAPGGAAAAVTGGNPFAPTVRGQVVGTPNAPGSTHDPRTGPNNWQSDNAVDYRVPVGTPVYAVTDGTIGPQLGSLGSSGRFQGLRLTLQGAQDSYWYGHLSRYAPGLRAGEHVRAGQLLGYTGSANGVPHLHLGEERGNPMRFFR